MGFFEEIAQQEEEQEQDQQDKYRYEIRS